MCPHSTDISLPRNCVGKNLAYPEKRLVLAHLFGHFDLEAGGEMPKSDGQESFVVGTRGHRPSRWRSEMDGIAPLNSKA